MRMTQSPTVVAVRSAMAAAGVTQEDVATALGLSQAAISRRHRGETEWTAAELHSLAHFLHVPVATLITPAPHLAEAAAAGGAE